MSTERPPPQRDGRQQESGLSAQPPQRSVRAGNTAVISASYARTVVRRGVAPRLSSNAAHCQNCSASTTRVAASSRTAAAPPGVGVLVRALSPAAIRPVAA